MFKRFFLDPEQEYALIQSVLSDFSLSVDGRNACDDLAGAIRVRQVQQEKSAQELAQHKARRAQGYHVVVLKRCWECGRTQILGELDDDMRTVRMPREDRAVNVAWPFLQTCGTGVARCATAKTDTTVRTTTARGCGLTENERLSRREHAVICGAHQLPIPVRLGYSFLKGAGKNTWR